MKRFARVFTSAMLAGAMMMTMGGMTAFAAVEEIGFNKSVLTEGDTYAPNTEFVFTIAPGVNTEEVKEGELTTKKLTQNEFGSSSAGDLDVYNGIQGGLKFDLEADLKDPNIKFDATNGNEYVNGFKFSPDMNGEDALPTSTYSKSGKLKTNAAVFTKPGVYYYTITETDGGYDGINYDTKRDVYLYVVRKDGVDGNPDTFEVDSVVVAKDGVKQGGEGSDITEKGINFVNSYGDGSPNNPGSNDSTHDVTITKKVDGNQGDKNASFEFTVAVNNTAVFNENNPNEAREWYKVVITNGSTETVAHIVANAPAVTYSLKHGDSIQIFGLSDEDTYTVTETAMNQNGYVTSEGTENEKGETINAPLSGDGATLKDSTKRWIWNYKNVSSPTGIVLSFAPYIMLVALAGVFAVLFLRKKKEEF